MTEVSQGVLQEVLHRETSRHMAIREVLHEVIPDDDEVIEEVFPSGDQVLPGHTSTLQAPTASTNGGMTEVVPGHTEVIPAQAAARRARRGRTEVIPTQPTPTQASPQGRTEVLPFDTTRYRLGKLCPRGHDYQGTGQSYGCTTRRGTVSPATWPSSNASASRPASKRDRDESQ